MFKNTMKKLAGLGLALCMAGTLILIVPATATAPDSDFAPFTIHDPFVDGDDN